MNKLKTWEVTVQTLEGDTTHLDQVHVTAVQCRVDTGCVVFHGDEQDRAVVVDTFGPGVWVRCQLRKPWPGDGGGGEFVGDVAEIDPVETTVQ